MNKRVQFHNQLFVIALSPKMAVSYYLYLVIPEMSKVCKIGYTSSLATLATQSYPCYAEFVTYTCKIDEQPPRPGPLETGIFGPSIAKHKKKFYNDMVDKLGYELFEKKLHW